MTIAKRKTETAAKTKPNATFGMWADRGDANDPAAYVRAVRQTRRLAALSGLIRLIAATAIEHKLAIVTTNTRRLQSVKTLKIEAFKPR